MVVQDVVETHAVIKLFLTKHICQLKPLIYYKKLGIHQKFRAKVRLSLSVLIQQNPNETYNCVIK